MENLDNSTIHLDNSANPDDHYAKTKYDSEVLVEQSNINHTILRISGVSIPVFQNLQVNGPFYPIKK